MESSGSSIADGLFKAIQAEGDGYHFYLMAAGSTDDPKGQKIFETLAGEELEHQRFLKAQYMSYLKTGGPDINVRLGQRANLYGESPIFSEALRDRVKDAHFEMSALSIGIQLELAASKFYKDQAEAASELAVKTFFLELAEWETGHYEVLLRQQEALKEDYWTDAGFSPF
ncbi:ferritin family protein [Thermodesulfobacteriota bacterium]